MYPTKVDGVCPACEHLFEIDIDAVSATCPKCGRVWPAILDSVPDGEGGSGLWFWLGEDPTGPPIGET
jgi:hypothetical protein